MMLKGTRNRFELRMFLDNGSYKMFSTSWLDWPMVFPYGLTRRSSRNLWTFGGKWTVVREYKGSSPLKGQVWKLACHDDFVLERLCKKSTFCKGGISSQCILHIKSCWFSTLYLFSGQLYCNHAFHSKMPGGALPYPMSPKLGVPHL